MSDRLIYGVLMLGLAVLTGCQKQETLEAETGVESVDISLAFAATAPSPALTTRMTDQVTQYDGTYRGIDMLAMIPFRTAGKIAATDRPLRLLDTAEESAYTGKASPIGAFYQYNTYTAMTGTASFLVYAKARPAKGEKAYDGSLIATLPASQEPSGISFSPDHIRSSAEVPAAAQTLADCLTRIANTQASDGLQWSKSNATGLETLYQNFIGQTTYAGDYMVMAGSSTNVRKHIDALKDALNELTYTDGTDEAKTKTAVLDEISGVLNTVSATADYPASIGLPDGAAALQWNGSAFVPQTQTTTKAPVTTISRYCYPPALYYFANSRIHTSDTGEKATYYQTANTWADVLTRYEHKNGTVRSGIQAVAITDPLQYGVARLAVTMKASSTSLKDRRGQTIELGEKTFPLTGIIVGNQHQLGFDFTPQGTEQHLDDRFIYDKEVKQTDGTPYYLSTTPQTVPSTLVLQSYDGETVTVIMEFQNDSGQDFYGEEGIIRQGTRFYLIGNLTPSEGTATNEDIRKRVFTQDHTTTVTTTVDGEISLSHAYNVLPDILGGRMEIGIELTPKWIEATPTTVPLE